MQDFDMAAKLKDALTNINKYMIILNETQDAMKHAAEEEDYVSASKLKAKRDGTQVSLFSTFDKAENIAAQGLQYSHEDEDERQHEQEHGQRHGHGRKNADNEFALQLDDLSLSTIRRDQDDPSVLTATTTRQFLNDRSILPRDDANDFPFFEGVSTIVETSGSNESSNKPSPPRIEGKGSHPLEGVPGFEDLPAPEEIKKIEQGLSTSFNQNTSHTSTDSIHKIEALLGEYCTRCLLSKNWSLREAAILKLCMKLKEVTENIKSAVTADWWEPFSRGICLILERAIEDRIVQVFLTGLILLDDCVTEFEVNLASQKDTISLLGNVIMKLVGKLGDSNPKVVEGSETALMSLALSKLIGPMHIGSQVIKLMSVADQKAVKSVTKRCEFLRGLLEEFGPEAPSLKKHLEFIKSFCLGHKDSDARESAKDLSVVLFLRDGNEVLSLLTFLTDRQAKEYKLAFLNAKRAQEVPESRGSERHSHSEVAIDKTVGLTLNENSKTPGKRGRGRGRSRRSTRGVNDL